MINDASTLLAVTMEYLRRNLDMKLKNCTIETCGITFVVSGEISGTDDEVRIGIAII